MATLPRFEHPILVIGGGVGGVATALALHRAGINAVCFERAPEWKAVGAGLSLWPNATRVLEELGCLDAVRAASDPVETLVLRRPDGSQLTRVPIHPARTGSRCIHRADLHDALRADLPDDRLRTDHELAGYEVVTTSDDGGVVARFESGQTVRGAALVGADGIKSVVRRQLLDDGAPVYRGYTAWRGVVEAPDDPTGFSRGEVTETLGHGARFGSAGIGEGWVYWYATVNAPEGEPELAPGERHAALFRHFGRWHAPIPDLIARTPAESILKTDIADRPATGRWGAGHVTLLGDAAHPTTPNMGQGGCLALEDALILAREVARHATTAAELPAAFRRYERLRQPRTARIVQQSRQFGWIAQWQNPLAVAARDWLTRVSPTHLLQRSFREAHSFSV